jgi:hypothetical protein
MTDVSLCLVSHTNAGKTTLARTLLRRDIGEIADRAHVTELAERHELIAAGDDALYLWDTPGFGDSVRLLGRLRATDRPLANPIGWFLSAVWDRYADRPFWCSQQAMKSARDEADLVLYVANAAEDPASAAYVDPELEILAWLGKPVLVLLNQLGTAADAAVLHEDVRRWEAVASRHPVVRGVLPFDAFARCWVQEHVLLASLAPHVPDDRRAAWARLAEAWRERDLTVLRRSADVLAAQLAPLAADRESLAPATMSDRARGWLDRLAGRETRDLAAAAAEAALAERLDALVRRSTEELVRLHGLTGRASGEILQRLGHEFETARAVDAGSATAFGGLVSGALGGLAADVAAGGLTLGAGALLGGVLGALGARGVAQAYNVARGSDSGRVAWSAEFLHGRVLAALARYLAVAHFGRGRGDYVDGSLPEAWRPVLRQAVDERHEAWAAAWREAQQEGGVEGARRRLEPELRAALIAVLVELYPASAGAFAGGTAGREASAPADADAT